MSSRKLNHLFAIGLSISTACAASCGGSGGSGGDGDGDGDTSAGDGDGDSGDGDGDAGGSGDGDGDGSGGSATGGGSGAEGGEGGEVQVPEDFELVSQLPESGAENVSARAPLVLEFTTDVDRSSVDGAIRIRSGGEDMPFSATVNGRFIEILLDEVPSLPASISVAVTSALLSSEGVAFDGDSWSYDLPLWQRPETFLTTSEIGLAAAAGPLGEPFALAGSDSLTLFHYQGGQWVEHPLPASNLAASPVVGLTAPSEPVVAWKERSGGQDSVQVARFDGATFIGLGDGPATTASSLEAQLVADSAGSPIVVALDGSGQLTARGLVDDAWSTLGSSLSSSGTQAFVAAHSGTRLFVAVVDGASDIRVYEWAEQAWSQVGETIDRERTSDVPGLSLAAQGDQIYLAYQDGDAFSQHALVRQFDGIWSPVGSALDLEMNNEVSHVSVSLDSQGKPFVAWVEELAGRPAAVAARQEGNEWRVLGELLFSQLGATASFLSTTVDAAGDMHVTTLGSSGPRVARFNGSPTLPLPKVGEGSRGSCTFPLDDEPDFPQTLAETGCYENLATRTLVDAAIPYNVNSVLWTDNAYKKRYLLIPEGGTVDFSLETELGVPVGTIVVKEFYAESVVGDPSSRIPVETRFLIKRCEEADANCEAETAWQGYTYQWNSGGSDGSLLNNTAIYDVDWTVSGGTGTYTHQYPSRTQCLECHNDAGRLLGVSGAQLNRPGIFGGVIENQIRALAEAGFFGDSAPDQAPEELARIPSPPDVSRSLEDRTRAYFQSNCSHCHRSGGLATAPVIPYFDYFGPELAAGNMCQNNRIVPGDHSASSIWLRDSSRAADQMPPLATLVPDTQQLPVTAAWIDSLDPNTTCP